MASHFHILRYIASFVDQATMYLAARNQKVPCDSKDSTHTCHTELNAKLDLLALSTYENLNDDI